MTQVSQITAVNAGALFVLVRPRQWIKNAFVAAPLFLTPMALSPEAALRVALGIVTFCLLSSTVYILNDFVDRASDRLHPTKRYRPLASGAVSPRQAGLLALALLTVGLGMAAVLSSQFLAIALAYLVVNAAYSLKLKHIAIVDVMLVALGFIFRVEAGAALVDIGLSAWIIIATGLLALFIALAKRRDDLSKDLQSDHRRSLDGYTKGFIDVAMTVVLGSLLVSYLIYTTDQQVLQRLGTDRVYLTAPFVVAGVLRYLQIALVYERAGSPTKLVTSDFFLIACVMGWVVTFASLIYG